MSKTLKIILCVIATLATVGGTAFATYLYTNDVKQEEITQLNDQIETLKVDNETLSAEIRKSPVVTESSDTTTEQEANTDNSEESKDTDVVLPVDTTKYGTFTGNYIAGVSGDFFPAKLCFESLNNFGTSYCYYSTTAAEFQGPRSIPVGQYNISVTPYWPKDVNGSKIFRPMSVFSYTVCQNTKPTDPSYDTNCKIEKAEIKRLVDECKQVCTSGAACDNICTRYSNLSTSEKNGMLYGVETNTFTINEGQNTDIGTIYIQM